MVGKVVATPHLQWSQPSVTPQSSSASAAMATKKGRSANDVVLGCRSAWLGTMSSKLYRTRSYEFSPRQQRPSQSIRRVCSASLDSFSDEEFSRKIQDMAVRFHHSDDEVADNDNDPEYMQSQFQSQPEGSVSNSSFEPNYEPPDWTAIVEMKANSSAYLPLSLPMIKRKKQQWKEEFIEAGESAYCSVKTAFSSMVFIIRELHSYTLQMRELLFYEDLNGILARVQGEMHASFVWLFQQVFSHTPTLMVYIMILLANFTVHSLSNSASIAAHAAVPPAISSTVEERLIDTTTSTIKSFSVSASGGGNTASVGGKGGGSKAKPVASGTGGDGWVNRAESVHRPIMPDGVSPLSTREEESVSGRQAEEEVGLWNSIVEEASGMQGKVRDEALDHDTLQRFVSPVTANIETDVEDEEYFRTELLYQTGLAQEPSNVLLLANYAQFLYLVIQDYDRAEEYFKRAVGVEPKDAEAHNKYATFLWKARNDLWAAEETFLEAISADPSNSFYAANYAHFLWNTGGEDTCFPLNDETLDA